MNLKSRFLLRSSGDGFVHLDPGLGLFDLQLLVNSVEMKDVRLDLVVLCLSLQALILKKDVLLLEPSSEMRLGASRVLFLLLRAF